MEFGEYYYIGARVLEKERIYISDDNKRLTILFGEITPLTPGFPDIPKVCCSLYGDNALAVNSKIDTDSEVSLEIALKISNKGYPYFEVKNIRERSLESVRMDIAIMDLACTGKTCDQIADNLSVTKEDIEKRVLILIRRKLVPHQVLVDEATEELIQNTAMNFDGWSGKAKDLRELLSGVVSREKIHAAIYLTEKQSFIDWYRNAYPYSYRAFKEENMD